MQHIFKKFLVIGAMALALSACVSTKKFDLQTSELNATQKKLNDAVIAQQNLQLDLKKLKDSIQTARKNDRQHEIDDAYSLYRTAVKTADYPQASASLQKLLLLDSSQAYWAYDSLAIYHYMYLIVPGSTKRSPAAQYFVDKGLSINPNNDYLMEIKGKLLIEGGNDTAAYRIFNNLWNKTGDFTYLWDMTYIDLNIYGKVKATESLIAEVVKKPESVFKMVRVEQMEEHLIESIPAKAAFLYMRAIIEAQKGGSAKAIKTLEEVLKLSPTFLSAQRAMFQLKNPQYR